MDGLKIKTKFYQIKDRITRLENELQEELNELQDKTDKWEKLEQQAEFIKATKGNQIVRFNIYGKKFATTIKTLLSAKDSLFYQMILSNEVNLEEELFFEVDPIIFSYILDFLRTKVINLKRLSKDELTQLRQACEYFEITDILSELGDSSALVYFDRMEFSGPYTCNGTVGTNKVEDLNDPNTLTGTCTPGPAWIILQLNREYEFDTIYIQGYTGNTTAWSPNNGVNALIKVSLDKHNWVNFGSIPVGFGNTMKTITSTIVKAKYVKLEIGSYLGIGFIKVDNITGKKKNLNDSF